MCTNLSFSNKSGSYPIISARTMDFPIELTSFVRFVPRHQTFPENPMPKEVQWVNKYGFIGIVHTQPGLFMQAYSDGLNEKGLSAACLWLEGSQYAKPKPGVPNLYNNNVVSYILGNFKNITEAEEGLGAVTVVGITDPLETPTHIIVSDASSNHLIIEFVGGEMKTYISGTGVLTNEPTFDWHQTNLQNYGNLSLVNNPNKVNHGEELYGSGQFGSPGDPTAASRFVRANLFSHSTFQPRNVQESIGLAVQVINTIAVPCGTVVASDSGNLFNWTQWIDIRDHTNCGLYFYSAFNSSLYGIHLRELDMNAQERREIDLIRPSWYVDITRKFEN